MAISDPDTKRLWGLSAGICSNPKCRRDCIPLLNTVDPTVVGEMAHVIAHGKADIGGRGSSGEDTYENLILLCPTCHTEVDKAPSGTFDEDALHRWKRDHEADVRARQAAPVVGTRQELASLVLRLLADNKATWQTYGPESAAAKRNPLSSASLIWGIRKVTQVVPRNAQIVALVQTNSPLLSNDEYSIAAKFTEHAAGFEASSYDRKEDVPRFPVEFEEMMHHVAATE